ncbi:hypothetical protein NO559_07020 [Dasania sp. GY-MA-18]|uniref:Uncharacterized protein n=1 Tax=Dasania phycosphaerae TaxID=2950436 RepID=A0A9J6RKL7_9GAMM|nr:MULTISPECIES: hypothetical protein [Dasania]MCR8922518.1 hypothetical protein [Dasania sp. GY-MA-18]MCZ0864946.1 hypothetical protein [Dasania phycosphaerae]MCZ0868674.1 hypothetical protein [Dasania phycosphaerae]
MNTLKYSTLFALIILIASCGKSEEPAGVIPEHQMQALESAKNVEQVLKDAEQQNRQQIEPTP